MTETPHRGEIADQLPCRILTPGANPRGGRRMRQRGHRCQTLLGNLMREIISVSPTLLVVLSGLLSRWLRARPGVNGDLHDVWRTP